MRPNRPMLSSQARPSPAPGRLKMSMNTRVRVLAALFAVAVTAAPMAGQPFDALRAAPSNGGGQQPPPAQPPPAQQPPAQQPPAQPPAAGNVEGQQQPPRIRTGIN